MATHLEAMVAAGELKTGERLPSLRDLCSQFDVKLNTARRGIWHLRDKGILECRHGDGVYVAEKRTAVNPRYRVAVFADVNSGSYSIHILRGVQDAALSSGVILEIHPESYYQHSEEELLSLIAEAAKTSDALLLIGTYDCTLRRMSTSRPVVGVEMQENYGGLVSTFTLDPFAAATTAIDYFNRRNVKKIKIFRQNTPIGNIRAAVFRSLWTGESAAEFIAEPNAYVGIEQELMADPECGYLFTDGSLCNVVVRNFKNMFGENPNDVRHMLSFDGKSLLSQVVPPVNSVLPNWQEAGALALAEALRRINTPGSSALRGYLNVKLETVEKKS
jgi:DNA-binding LacI/PurR family transcriptional regulator